MKKKLFLVVVFLLLGAVCLYATGLLTYDYGEGWQKNVNGYRIYSYSFTIKGSTNDTTYGIDAGQFTQATIQSWNGWLRTGGADSINYTLNLQGTLDGSHWFAVDSMLVSGADSTVSRAKKLTLKVAKEYRLLTVSNNGGADSLYAVYNRLILQQ